MRKLFVFIPLLFLFSMCFSEAVLFVYHGKVDANLWNASHRLGQLYFAKAFPELEIKELGILSEATEDIFEQLDDYDLVFVTESSLKSFFERFMNESSKLWICNDHSHGYFVKDYQATFLLGLTAGLYKPGEKVAVLIDSIDKNMYFRMVNALLLGLREAGYQYELDVFQTSTRTLEKLSKELRDYSIVVNLSTSSELTQWLEELKIENLGFFVDQSMKGREYNLLNIIINWGVVYSKIYQNEFKVSENPKNYFDFGDRALVFSPISFKVDQKIFEILEYFKKKMISNEYKVFGDLEEVKVLEMNEFLEGVVIK